MIKAGHPRPLWLSCESRNRMKNANKGNASELLMKCDKKLSV
jgi:hypothetical protein